MNLGSMSAQDALDSVGIGQARAKAATDFVDTSLPNGYPGFEAIWQKAWGLAQGILNPAPTIASTTSKTSGAAMTPVVLGVVAVGALLAIVALRKSPKSRYRRMKARR